MFFLSRRSISSISYVSIYWSGIRCSSRVLASFNYLSFFFYLLYNRARGYKMNFTGDFLILWHKPKEKRTLILLTALAFFPCREKLSTTIIRFFLLLFCEQVCVCVCVSRRRFRYPIAPSAIVSIIYLRGVNDTSYVANQQLRLAIERYNWFCFTLFVSYRKR